MERGPVAKSGGFLARWIPWRGPRSCPWRTTGRAAAGFWRARGGTEGYQQLRKRLADAGRGERTAGGALGPLPGQMHLVDGPTGEAQLRVGQQHQPGPAVRLLWVAHAGRGPVEHLLAEAVGVLQIEAVDIRPPEHSQVRRAGPAPPQPQALGNPRLAGQALDLEPALPSHEPSAAYADSLCAGGSGSWHARPPRPVPARGRTARALRGAPQWGPTSSARPRRRTSPRAVAGGQPAGLPGAVDRHRNSGRCAVAPAPPRARHPGHRVPARAFRDRSRRRTHTGALGSPRATAPAASGFALPPRRGHWRSAARGARPGARSSYRG